MTKQRMKDMLQKEAKMVNEQATLIKRLYAEQDNLVHRIKILDKENKLLQARCTEWQKRALELMIELTNVRADFDILSEAERKRIRLLNEKAQDNLLGLFISRLILKNIFSSHVIRYRLATQREPIITCAGLV